MEKAIKKIIEKYLNDKNPPIAWQSLIAQYLLENNKSEKGIIIQCRYFAGWGYWRTMRYLNREGFYISQAVFYRRLNEGLTDIALRAAYDRLICPFDPDFDASECGEK